MEKLLLTFKKYFFWAVLGLFIFIPLYPKFPLFNVPGTYVAVRLEDFLIGLVFSGWLFIFGLKYIKNLLQEPITQAIVLFWLIGLLSLYSGLSLTNTVTPHLGLLHYLRRVEVMLLFFLALSAFTTKKQVKIWLFTMLFVTLVLILYGFGQQWLNFPVISTTNKEFSKGLILFLTPEARVNSTFAGHYDLAIFLAFFLTAAASMFFYTKKIISKLCLITVSIMGFILLIMTAARVSFIAVLLGIGCVFWFLGRKKLILLILAAGILALTLSPELRHRTVATFTVNFYGGGGPKYVPPPQKPGTTTKFSIENAASGATAPSGVPIDIVPGEPLNTTELGVFRSYAIRLNVEWPRAIRAFEKNPFLGTGYSSITIATDNDYLRSLGETGFLGTASLTLIFIIFIKKSIKFLKRSEKNLDYHIVLGVVSGLITIFITMIFIDVLESSKVAELFWLTLGATFAIIKMEDSNEKNIKNI